MTTTSCENLLQSKASQIGGTLLGGQKRRLQEENSSRSRPFFFLSCLSGKTSLYRFKYQRIKVCVPQSSMPRAAISS